ncbi:MAG: hypothetical protein AB1443_06010 [Pseudomonadota bacterium]
MRSAISALVGNIRVGRGNDDFISIDVVDDILGMKAEEVRKRSIAVAFGAVTARIMHPLDVLESRAANYAGIPEKQTPEGLTQLRLAIDVATRFLDTVRKEETLIDAAEIIARIHKVYSSKAAIRHAGIDLLLPLESLKTRSFSTEAGKNFAAIRLPQLMAKSLL